MTATTTPRPAQPAPRHGPGTAGQGRSPVVIVRSATIILPRYLCEHRRRQRAANQFAAELTEQCRTGRHRFVDQIGVDLDDHTTIWCGCPNGR